MRHCRRELLSTTKPRTRLQRGGLLWDAHIFGNAVTDRSADSREAETNRGTHIEIECRSPVRIVAEHQHNRSAGQRPEHRCRRLDLARPHADEYQIVRGPTRIRHDAHRALLYTKSLQVASHEAEVRDLHSPRAVLENRDHVTRSSELRAIHSPDHARSDHKHVHQRPQLSAKVVVIVPTTW